MWYDSFICTEFICDMSYPYVTWRISMRHHLSTCDVTHSYVMWLIHMWCDASICDMTPSLATGLIHVWRDVFIWTRRIHQWHDAFICDVTHSYLTWRIHMWRDSLTHTGWRRPIGCLKLQVIFCKRATNCRALLQEMTYKDTASYGSSPPCTNEMPHSYLTWRVHTWRAWFICCVTHSYVTRRIHMRRDSLMYTNEMHNLYVTWHIRTWRASFICCVSHSCVPWLIFIFNSFICAMAHLYATHSYMPRLIYMWLIHMCHDLFIFDSSICAMIYSCVTHSYVP